MKYLFFTFKPHTVTVTYKFVIFLWNKRNSFIKILDIDMKNRMKMSLFRIYEHTDDRNNDHFIDIFILKESRRYYTQEKLMRFLNKLESEKVSMTAVCGQDKWIHKIYFFIKNFI